MAEELHFGRAAERLHVSQPTVSVTVRDLERLLGLRLLDRSKRGATVTAAGARMLVDARRVLSEAERLGRHAAQLAQGLTGTLVVGLHDEGAAELTWPILAAFKAAEPDVRIVVRSLTHAQLPTALEGGEVDVLLGCVDWAAEHETVELFHDPLGVILGPGHVAYEAQILHAADLLDLPMLGLSPDDRHRERHFGPYWLAEHRNGETDFKRGGDITDLAAAIHTVALGEATVGSSASTQRFALLAPCRWVPLVDGTPLVLSAARLRRGSAASRTFLRVAGQTAAALGPDLVPSAIWPAPAVAA